MKGLILVLENGTCDSNVDVLCIKSCELAIMIQIVIYLHLSRKMAGQCLKIWSVPLGFIGRNC